MELRAALEAAAHPGLRADEAFAARLAALDALEFRVLDTIEGILGARPVATPEVLRDELVSFADRADQLKRSLETIDDQLFARLRLEIRAGGHRGAGFRDLLGRYAGMEGLRMAIPHAEATDPGTFGTGAGGVLRGTSSSPVRDDQHEDPAFVGYDVLDEFVNGLLLSAPLPGESVVLDPEMVGYQQTPVRVILELTERGRFARGDVFFDLGSGTGRVSMLVNLLAGVPAEGVEVDPGYAGYANERAAELGLGEVVFVARDAREADCSRATVFFLYTPFRGEIFRVMLSLLEHEAETRRIRIFAWGPCVSRIRAERWLVENAVNGKDFTTGLAEFVSR